MLLQRYHLVGLWFCCSRFWQISISSDPLHLTPFLDAGDITTALKLSEVRDSKKIIPKSYAGFITVDRKLGNHLFFWFFPAIIEPQAPVLVWLNGGPAITSMLGLLWGNGPIRVIEDANGEVTYTRWQKSWAEYFSMLYIDNPVGTGYSYSDNNGWKITMDGYTDDLFSFMNQFYIMFPEYLKQELYIGGQSYAGKYVPALAHRIHKEIQANRSSLPLAGIYLGNPFFDPFTQSTAQGHFYYSIGAASYAQFMNHKKIVRDIFEGNVTTIGEDFVSIFRKLTNVTEYVENNYDTAEQPAYSLVEALMNTQHIREMVHAGTKLNFTAMNLTLNAKYVSDILLSTKPMMAELMNIYKVLIYSGDFDGIITAVMTEEAILSIPWSLQKLYNESDRIPWLSRKKIRGFYTQMGRFCRVIIYRAGHQTPYDQPYSTRDMMMQFVHHGCLNQAFSTSLGRNGQILLTGEQSVVILLLILTTTVLRTLVHRT